LIRWLVGYRRQLGGGGGGTKERLWPQQRWSSAYVMLSALKAQVRTDQGQGGSSSFERLSIEDDRCDDGGLVYTSSVGGCTNAQRHQKTICKQGIQTATQTNCALGNCTQRTCIHKHRASVHSALAFNNLLLLD
jgi:hypothetical protein